MLHIESVANGVTVHAADARIRKQFLQTLLTLLRTSAEIEEMLAFAFGASLGNGLFVSAVVAFQTLACGARNRLVMRKRDGAGLALQLLSARAAKHGKRISPAIEQDDRLLTTVECGLRPLQQCAGENLVLPRLLK